MTLRLIAGRAGAGKTERCLQEITEELRREADDFSLVMILPEHATFKVEKRLAAMAQGGFTRGYVFGFKRLAQRILMETGGALRPRVHDVGKRLLLAKILGRNEKGFKTLRRAARQRKFTQSMTALIEEFKSYCVQPGSLRAAAERMENSPLGDKLQDLALIYDSFQAAMQDRYTDAEDSLTALAERIPESAILRQAQVWVDGFLFFNPQELVILRALLQTARSVTVTLSLEAADDSEQAMETALFHRQWKTFRQLQSLASELGASLEILECARQRRFQNPALEGLEAGFYRRLPAPDGQACQDVRIVEAANGRMEVEGAAVDILRLCRQEGFRWRDIGVLVRDAETYTETLEAVFEDYEIPFFSDAKRRCAHHPLAELLRSALEAIRGWRYEPLFRCFKTDFFPVSRNQVDILENYVLEFGIRGARWTMEEEWTYRRRLSLDEECEADEESGAELAQINAVRRMLIAPLAAFSAQMGAAKTAAMMTEAAYGLLMALEVPQQMERWAMAQEREGNLAAAGEHRQLWDNIILLFDQLVETCGEEEMTAAAYGTLLDEGLEGLTLSLIPPGLDYVTIAAFDQNSLDNIKAVYILGVNEGVIPQRGRGEGLLTDAERSAMAAAGVSLSPGMGAEYFVERFRLYSALTRASSYLWLSYALSDSEGKGLLPSSLLREIREILSIHSVESIPQLCGENGARWQIARPRRAVSNLAGALQLARKKNSLEAVWRDVYNWALGDEKTKKLLDICLAGLFQRYKTQALPPELAKRLFTDKRRLRGSVTRFERFRACPFQHFAQYGLKLKERAEHRFAAPDLGQFLHAALKEFGERMKAQGRDWGSVSEKEYRALCAAIVGELAPKLQNEILLSSAQHQHLLSRIRRTVELSVQRLVAFDRVSAFKPIAFEQSFGRGRGALPPLSYLLADGYQLEISGQIDRVDAFEYDGENYFLVIDYKSGNAYLNLIDVYYGLRLQLLTYLLVAENAAQEILNKPALPAGVLYYFLKNPVLSEKRKVTPKEAIEKVEALLKMPGWVLADVDMLRQIDSSFKFIKVAVTTKNTIHSASRGSVKTQEEFTELLSYIGFILSDTGRQILDGAIEPMPYELNGNRPCTYCAYHSFCRFDSLLPEYESRALEKMDSEVIMERIAAKNAEAARL